MSAYLMSWLTGVPAQSTSTSSQQTSSESRKIEDADDSEEVSISVASPEAAEGESGHESDADSDATDTPPAFPALNSAQRMANGTSSRSTSSPSNLNSSPLPKVLTDAALMPPPPPPNSSLRIPGVPSQSSRSTLNGGGGLKPTPSLTVSGVGIGSRKGAGGMTLGVPPTTTKPPTKKAREKVALTPGYGPLDWAALKSSGQDLRGVDTLIRVTPSMLREHGKEAQDVWSVFNNKVYNITHYLPFHPGGEKELMRVAGRDGTKLFVSTHAWVNVDFMLDQCLVGFLVPESSGS